MSYKIEDFGHVFAIAFGLSAIFYYAELSEATYRRWTRVLLLLADADKTASDARKLEIMEQVKIDMAGGLLRWGPLPTELRERLTKSRNALKKAKIRSYLISALIYAVFLSHIFTHILAWISALVSLVALLHSGFHPNMEFSARGITALLLLSFASIVWTFGFYGILLPIVTALVADPPQAAA